MLRVLRHVRDGVLLCITALPLQRTMAYCGIFHIGAIGVAELGLSMLALAPIMNFCGVNRNTRRLANRPPAMLLFGHHKGITAHSASNYAPPATKP